MASAVICPACQTRNRAQWDFCARCGESLENVAITESEEGPAPPGDLGPLYLVLMVTVLAGTVALACRDLANHPAPPAASPGVFTFGGQAPPGPSPAPVSLPGSRAAEAGRRLLAQGKGGEAIPLLEQAVAENPDNAEYQHLLGRALWDTGTREDAVRVQAEAARLDPAAYGVVYAEALEILGRSDEAVTAFEAALAAQPASSIAQEGLSRIYYRRGEFAKALPLLEALAVKTRNPVLMQQVAYAAEKTGDRERAIATYRTVLAAEPRSDVVRELLADSLLAAGQKEEAIGLLREGIERSPEAPLLQRRLGAALEQTGRTADAAAAYREFVRLAPNAPEAEQIAARAARLEASVRSGS